MTELGGKEYQSRRQWRKRTPKVWISSVCCVNGRMWEEWRTSKIGEVDYTLEKSRGNIDPDGCFTSFQVNLGPGVILTCQNFKLYCYDYFSYYFCLGGINVAVKQNQVTHSEQKAWRRGSPGCSVLCLQLHCLLQTRGSVQRRRSDDHGVYLFCFGTWKVNCRVLENTIDNGNCQEYSAITGSFQMQGFLPTAEVSTSDILADKIRILLS